MRQFTVTAHVVREDGTEHVDTHRWAGEIEDSYRVISSWLRDTDAGALGEAWETGDRVVITIDAT